MRFARFFYRIVLLAAPSALRRKHGAAMVAAVMAEMRRARAAGSRWGATRVLAAATWDALTEGTRERWRQWGRGPARAGNGDGIETGGRWMMMDVIRQDLRFAARALFRSPSLAFVAVVTLGLGIGANTALFSVVNGVMLRPLPFPEADRVTHLGWQRGPVLRGSVPRHKVEYWRSNARSFEAVTTWTEFSGRLGDGERLEGARGIRAGEDFFTVVGRAPVIGRAFDATDHVEGGAGVAIVSDRLWRDRFGGTTDILDRDVVLDGRALRVVGVLPADFAFPQAAGYTELVIPLRGRADPADEGENYPVLARLADDVTPGQADADVRRVTEAFRTEYPELFHESDVTMRLASFEEIYVGDLGSTLLILMGATGLVLLIACANVANLLMARAADRRDELALRRALGASRTRITAQLTIESAVLTLLAGAAGIVLARWGVDVLIGMSPSDLPRASEIGIDWRVLSVTFGVTALTGGLFGVAAASLIPGGRAARSARGYSRRPAWRSPTRRALIVGEAALAMVLLVGAGLLVETLRQLGAVDPGFATERVMTARFAVTPDGYASAGDVWALEDAVLGRLSADPAITGAAATSSVPLERGINMPMTLAARPEVFVGDVEWRAVTPGFFEALDIPLLQGRGFTDADGADAPQVVVVNEAFVREYFPDSDPIGERILIGHYNGRWIAPGFEGAGATIVGVARDIQEMSLKSRAKRTMWIPQAQGQDAIAARLPIFLVRGPDPRVAADRLRDAIAAVDPRLPVPEVRTMTEVMGRSVASERFNATLMVTFAALALVLTAFGIYGVVAYGVRQRTREMGIRMALGADRRKVVRLITLQGLAPVAIGLGVGVAASLYLTRYLSDLLWQVSATDPKTVVLVAVLLMAVAGVAAFVPARAATRVDPTSSLRGE